MNRIKYEEEREEKGRESLLKRDKGDKAEQTFYIYITDCKNQEHQTLK